MSFSNNKKCQELGKLGGGNRQSLKDSYVDLKVNKDSTEKEVRIRLIGLPFAFTQYTAKKYDADKKRVDVDFPDKEEKTKWSRNWISPGDHDDRYPEDPWAADGYIGSLRYAQNVLVRNDDDSFEVKILEKGKMLFDKFTDAEQMNIRRNEQRNKNYVTCLGGETTHDIVILAEFNPKKPLVPEMKIAVEPETSKITDEEIEALKAIGCPTEEELEELFAREPDLEQYPKWFWYGYQLPRIYKPDLYPDAGGSTGRATTSRGELDMSGSTPDDDGDSQPAATRSARTPSSTKPAATKPAAQAATAVAETTEDENAFGGDDVMENDW